MPVSKSKTTFQWSNQKQMPVIESKQIPVMRNTNPCNRIRKQQIQMIESTKTQFPVIESKTNPSNQIKTNPSHKIKTNPSNKIKKTNPSNQIKSNSQ